MGFAVIAVILFCLNTNEVWIFFYLFSCISSDAERVLAKSDHEIKKTKIKVSRWRRPEQRTLKVSGLPPLVEEEILELFFENEKKSGGGNVTKVQILNEGSALVTFEEEKGEIITIPVCRYVCESVCLGPEFQHKSTK